MYGASADSPRGYTKRRIIWEYVLLERCQGDNVFSITGITKDRAGAETHSHFPAPVCDELLNVSFNIIASNACPPQYINRHRNPFTAILSSNDL